MTRPALPHLALPLTALLLAVPAAAQTQPAPAFGGWSFGAVLDVAATSRALELGARDQGLQLGHSDLTASGPLGRHLLARITGVVATHDGDLEKAIEEAFVETTTLPLGLGARAGRFASQVGYLNEYHPHADDFVERPLLYRAFLGGHWYDDGLRVNVTLPTGLYWMVGAEVFRGRQLVPEADPDVGGAGAFTLATKIGGDLGRSHSWQLGLSYVHSRRIAAQEEAHGHDEEEAHDEAEEAHDHAHHHGARFGGEHLWLVDATWKWAPDGNSRDRQLRVTLEAARVTGINRYATSQSHDAVSLAVVWRFDPNWEVGARVDRLRVAIPHDDHFHDGELNEQALMVAWKPSHRQSLRLQLTRQTGAVGFEEPAAHSVALQYVLSFGAHAAHAY